MALALQTIADSVRYLANDTAGDRWDDTQLLTFIYEAHIQLINDAPDLCKERGVLEIVDGPLQSPYVDEDSAIHTIIAVHGICNSDGTITSALTEVKDTSLFLEDPTWMSATAATPVHWAAHSADPGAFYLYPFLATTGYVLADYLVRPEIAADLTESLGMFDETLLPAIVDYVLYRLYAGDSTNPANAAVANNYLSTYQGRLKAILTGEQFRMAAYRSRPPIEGTANGTAQ